jgi:hypothetical protein
MSLTEVEPGLRQLDEQLSEPTCETVLDVTLGGMEICGKPASFLIVLRCRAHGLTPAEYICSEHLASVRRGDQVYQCAISGEVMSIESIIQI